MTDVQKEVLLLLSYAMRRATECDLFDEMEKITHPDHIDRFSDAIDEMREGVIL